MSDPERAVSVTAQPIAIPMPGRELVPEWWARAFGPTTMFRTTLDTTKPDQSRRLLAALNEDCENAQSAINTDLDLIGFTLNPSSKEVDGEVQEWVRTVLHTADGRNIVCGSMGVVKSLMLMQQLIGPAPWNPPIKRRLISRPLRDGKHWYSLVEPPAAAAKRAKGE